MGLGDEIGNLLQRYAGGNPAGGDMGNPENDFDNVARHTSPDELSDGLSEAFRSAQTPPFPQMVGQLYDRSDSQQRAGMLNQLLGGAGPGLLGALLGGGGSPAGGRLGGLGGALGGGLGGGLAGGTLASILGGLMNSGGDQPPTVTPEEADRLSPEEVQEIAARAEQENPGIVDRLSGFYAQHPDLVKTLGGAALAIALGKMAQRRG